MTVNKTSISTDSPVVLKIQKARTDSFDAQKLQKRLSSRKAFLHQSVEDDQSVESDGDRDEVEGIQVDLGEVERVLRLWSQGVRDGSSKSVTGNGGAYGTQEVERVRDDTSQGNEGTWVEMTKV